MRARRFVYVTARTLVFVGDENAGCAPALLKWRQRHMFSLYNSSDKVERIFLIGVALGASVLVATLIYGFLFLEG
jgi:hypothetical protein